MRLSGRRSAGDRAKVKPAGWQLPKRQLSVRDFADSARLQVLTRWWDDVLQQGGRGLSVTGDLCDAVRDGVLPLHLLNALAGTDAAIPHTTPQSEAEQRDNLRTLATRLKEAHVTMVSPRYASPSSLPQRCLVRPLLSPAFTPGPTAHGSVTCLVPPQRESQRPAAGRQGHTAIH